LNEGDVFVLTFGFWNGRNFMNVSDECKDIQMKEI